jgi:hypothetical protein
MSWTQIFSAIHEQRAGGLAWLRYRLDMAGFEGSNPFRPIRKYRLLLVFWITNMMEMHLLALTPYENFLFALKAAETKRQYPHRLDKFLMFINLQGTIEKNGR